jgi:hypothetical protein
MTPTQRTIRELKNQGRICGIVERWNAHVPRGDGGKGIRQDFLGFIDVIALDPQRGVVGIQTTGTDFSGHFRKLTEEASENVYEWLRTPGALLELWAWRKVKKVRGGKAMIWQPRVREITLEDLR